MRQQPEATEARLALQPPGKLVAEGDHLERRGEHELARVQNERLTVGDLEHGGEVVLLLRRVDVRVQMVVEDPEEAVEPDVDAGRLHQRGIERLQLKLTGLELVDEVAVGKKHGRQRTWGTSFEFRGVCRTCVRYR